LSAFNAIPAVYLSINCLYQATGISSKHILVAVLPGLPTSAELFILPYQDATGGNKRTEDLEQVLRSWKLLREVYVFTFICVCGISR